MDQEYLGRQWMRLPHNDWVEVPKPPSIVYAFYHLAMTLLPHWQNHVLPNFDRATRKGWSYNGATEEGDLVVDLAQHFRVMLGYNRLYFLEGLNNESKGDVLEGIMGLEWMRPGEYDPDNTVSRTSTMVRNMWNTPNLINNWDMQAHAMRFHTMQPQLDYERQIAKIALKTDIMLTISCFIGHN